LIFTSKDITLLTVITLQDNHIHQKVSLNPYYAVRIDKEKMSYVIVHDGIKVAPILQKRLIIRNRGTLSPKMLTYLKYASYSAIDTVSVGVC